MGWFEYSCCGQTFTRMTRHDRTPMVCPICGGKVAPLVSLRVKKVDSNKSHRST